MLVKVVLLLNITYSLQASPKQLQLKALKNCCFLYVVLQVTLKCALFTNSLPISLENSQSLVSKFTPPPHIDLDSLLSLGLVD